MKDTYPNNNPHDCFRDDKLTITFCDDISDKWPDGKDNRVAVFIAGEWTGIHLRWGIHAEYAEEDNVLMWTVEGHDELGPFESRGEAVFAVISTTFDPE